MEINNKPKDLLPGEEEGSEDPSEVNPNNSTQEPIAFRECVKITNGSFNIELYSCCINAHALNEIALGSIDYLKKNSDKQSPGYIG